MISVIGHQMLLKSNQLRKLSIIDLVDSICRHSADMPISLYKCNVPNADVLSLSVSELMRFIHRIITYVVPAMPRAINWARPLIQNHHSQLLLLHAIITCL